MLNKHPRQTSHLGQNTENPAWYKNPTLLISILAIITSTFVGILSILNSRAIVNLDRNVYIPKLQYRIGQEEISKIYIEAINQGFTSANNVTVVVNWKTIEIEDCAPQPPFQDVQPVQPVTPGNLTFRLNALFPGDTFKLTCGINVSSGSISALQSDTPEPEYTPAAVTFSLPPELTTPAVTILLPSSADLDQLTQNLTVQLQIPQPIDLMKDILNIKITAENSSPGVEIGRPQRISIFIKYIVATTPVP